MDNFIQELKRRKVFRVAAVYAVVAWLLIQVADTLAPALQLPDWTVSLITVLLILGFVPTLIAAWAYESTPEGIRPDNQVQAAAGSAATSAQPVNYLILVVVLLVAGIQVLDRVAGTNDSSVPNRVVANAGIGSESTSRYHLNLGPIARRPI